MQRLRNSWGALLLGALLALGQPAGATIYNLLSSVTVLSPGSVPPLSGGGQIAQPSPAAGVGAGLGVSVGQSFLITVAGAPNVAVSCTVQFVGSNDPAVLTGDTTKWTNYGSTVTASGTGSAAASAYGSVPYQYFAAYVTAISGTSAACSVKMNG